MSLHFIPQEDYFSFYLFSFKNACGHPSIYKKKILHFKPAIFLVYVLKETDGIPTNYSAQHSQNIVNHLIRAEQLTALALVTHVMSLQTFSTAKQRQLSRKFVLFLLKTMLVQKQLLGPFPCQWHVPNQEKRAECACT